MTWPSCPICESNTAVERLPTPIGGRGLLCHGCVTVFAGTEEEWHRNEARRTARRKAAAHRARQGAA